MLFYLFENLGAFYKINNSSFYEHSIHVLAKRIYTAECHRPHYHITLYHRWFNSLDTYVNGLYHK